VTGAGETFCLGAALGRLPDIDFLGGALT
jgi:hypothetical protein